MAAMNGLDFEGEFNNAIDGLFKNNITRDISPPDQRALVTLIRESFLNLLDHFIDEDTMVSNSASKVPSQQSVKAYVESVKTTREFNRTFVEALVFDKNEIFHIPITLSADLNLTVGAGGLVDQAVGMRLRFIQPEGGTHAIFFGVGFDFTYGITSGQILSPGSYELYFLYTNGSVVVNLPGTSEQTSSLTQLLAPANFAAIAGVGDPETEIDLTWDDVDDEVEYQIEKSLTGTGGWVVLNNPVADATSYTETGLNPNETIFYRIKAIADGVTFADSPYTSVVSAQTESSGDVTAPTLTFSPLNGNNVWTINRPSTIISNEPLRNDDGTETTSANVATRLTLKQTNSGGANIPFSATIDGTKNGIAITPTTMYGENQLVYLAIDGVEDVNGNEITLQSITFTTTEYTFFNGTSNFLVFGDILDSLFAVNDTNFWLELTINNVALTGTRRLVSKNSQSGNQRGFSWYSSGSDIFFYWFRLGTSTNGLRGIKWAGALLAGEHTYVLKYDGAIDTNDGLDRLILLRDGGTVGSKTLEIGGGTTSITAMTINDSTALLAVGCDVDSAGTPIGVAFYSGEAKDFIIRSNAGATVEINVPNLKIGTDTSGNSRNGTWV